MSKEKEKKGAHLKPRFDAIASKQKLSIEAMCEKGKVSKPTFYKFIKDDIDDTNRRTFLNFCMNLGVDPDWVQYGFGEMMAKRPEMTIASIDTIVQDLREQVNLLRVELERKNSELDKKDQEIERKNKELDRKDRLIDGFADKFFGAR